MEKNMEFTVIGGSWDLVATSNCVDSPSSPRKAIEGDYDEGIQERRQEFIFNQRTLIFKNPRLQAPPVKLKGLALLKQHKAAR